MASLPGTNGSPGPQTPGSRLACDTGRQRLSAKLLWKPSGDFSDSDSDDFEEAGGRYFRVRWERPPGGSGRRGSCPHLPVTLQLSQQSHCPDFFLFLCRLLSPLLKAFAQAAAFLPWGQLPDTGEAGTPLAVLREGGALPVPSLGPLSLQSWATRTSSSSSYRPPLRRMASLVSPK